MNSWIKIKCQLIQHVILCNESLSTVKNPTLELTYLDFLVCNWQAHKVFKEQFSPVLFYGVFLVSFIHRPTASSRKIQQDVRCCIYFSTCHHSPHWLPPYKLCVLQMEIPYQKNFLRKVIHIQCISIYIVLLPKYTPAHRLLSISTAYYSGPSHHHLSLDYCDSLLTIPLFHLLPIHSFPHSRQSHQFKISQFPKKKNISQFPALKYLVVFHSDSNEVQTLYSSPEGLAHAHLSGSHHTVPDCLPSPLWSSFFPH